MKFFIYALLIALLILEAVTEDNEQPEEETPDEGDDLSCQGFFLNVFGCYFK